MSTNLQSYTSLKVTLFYPQLENSTLKGDLSIKENNFELLFDASWLENRDSTVYILVDNAKEELASCYRYELHSTTPEGIKVYR